MITTETKTSYRKTKTGEWVAYGPACVVLPGARVEISKANGTTKVEGISRVGRVFAVNGTSMVYGYLSPREDDAPAARRTPARRTRHADHEDCLSTSRCIHNSPSCDYH